MTLQPWIRVCFAIATMSFAGVVTAGNQPAQSAPDMNALTGTYVPEPSLSKFESGGAGATSAEPSRSMPAPEGQSNANAQPRGNPLWTIPLKSLNATRERPIFSPSRRPPTPAIAGPPPAPPPPPTVRETAEPPRLSLVGAVASQKNDAIAVFVDQTTRDVVRLRVGENHGGWILRSVKPRQAVLEKGRETITLALPNPNDAPR